MHGASIEVMSALSQSASLTTEQQQILHILQAKVVLQQLIIEVSTFTKTIVLLVMWIIATFWLIAAVVLVTDVIYS